MSNLIEKKFKNNDLGVEFNSFIDKKLRVWFKAKEVAKILGYKKTENAIKRHVSENNKRTFLLSCHPETGGQVIKDKKSCHPETGGQIQGRWIIFLNESGFYELVFRSRLPAAKMFRDWVFTKVLPSIRKYGYYKIIDSKRKQRVKIEGKKYFIHPAFTNYAANKNGEVINIKNKRNIKMSNSGNGYLKFNLYDKKLEKPYTYYHHRFVFEVFKGPIPKCFEIDHINEVKTDNRIKNLQLLTSIKNKQKSFSKPIISINIETGEERRVDSIKKASIELFIDSSSISKICRKKRKTLTNKYGKKYTFKFID